MNSTQTQPRYTEAQAAVVDQLTSKFDIDADQIFFLNPDKPDEVWLPSEALMAIARQTGAFQSISERFDSYVEQLAQIVHVATVIDKEGRTFERTGVATVGASIVNDKEIDAHALAGARALNSALRAAGFHPLRPASVATLDLRLQPSRAQTPDNAAQRDVDLAHIHKVAEEKGLIRHEPGGKRDVSAYRTFLFDTFGVKTVALLNQRERASVIEALRQLPDPVGADAS